ncbi:RNA-binding S4 domain-containing protein [Salinarimonas soli]|uniref:RNA-binding S4 domain-containing protein n=1 Tax=Salinarimonas soli TaxID=1638099 RepID=A0A5B2VE88_9HYPH|nr:RNA-binding S4 domain-containing protein [Salinarimonas soli]KAA2237105.1 RNA-binding S4 domain-containing protein [Salinarimonas soli]
MREDRQRLDKWLWYARFARTRSMAARLVTDGYVRVNGQRCENAAKALAVGDVVTVAAPHGTAAVRVIDLGERRGSATQARELYEDAASS